MRLLHDHDSSHQLALSPTTLSASSSNDIYLSLSEHHTRASNGSRSLFIAIAILIDQRTVAHPSLHPRYTHILYRTHDRHPLGSLHFRSVPHHSVSKGCRLGVCAIRGSRRSCRLEDCEDEGGRPAPSREMTASILCDTHSGTTWTWTCIQTLEACRVSDVHSTKTVSGMDALVSIKLQPSEPVHNILVPKYPPFTGTHLQVLLATETSRLDHWL